MSLHNPSLDEREDGDTYDEDRERAPSTRRWLMRQAGLSQNPIVGMLFELEGMASPFFLGTDYDPDLSDLDDSDIP